MCALGDIKWKCENACSTDAQANLREREKNVEKDEIEKIIISKRAGGVSEAANKKRFNFLR